MTDLEREIKTLLIDSLNLEGLSAEEIDSDAALFVEGLGLDSIDALELGVALQEHFQVRLDASNSANKEHFRSVRNLARYINEKRLPGDTAISA